MSKVGKTRRATRDYRGYAEVTARRVWRLAGLDSMEELFSMHDAQLLQIPGVGRATIACIRRLQAEAQK